MKFIKSRVLKRLSEHIIFSDFTYEAWITLLRWFSQFDKYYWASTQKNLFFFRKKQFRYIAMHSDGENYNKRNVIRKYKKENYKWTSR